jgi:serine/threonine protein phosphatase PrpC
MSSPSPATKIEAASISDRGLSEKRPLNEDSFLADPERCIFVVADGVGGADAGEIASKTAVDVLDDAFRERVADGEDIEDRMELAIQRANSSIHQMAAEDPRFSMMATTVVALHLDGHRATIGHVGDSRLYRVSPDGKLHRETEDHSIVEEEVRAGRMTPEQAANHPSKNVISRALGAENSVEADMKMIEVEEGSAFLLCTDGITRHIPDNELRDLLSSGRNPSDLCAEMKRRCYQRGAEDNLTAVIIQVGTPKFAAVSDNEPTVSFEDLDVPTEPANVPETPVRLTPPSRVAFPGPSASEQTPKAVVTMVQSRKGRPVLRFFVFLLFLAVAVAAFYGGIKYQQRQPATQPPPVQTTASASDASAFAAKRAAVDADAQKWIKESLPAQLSAQGIAQATDSKDAEFLYLYGRALMLAGNHRDAMQAFELALTKIASEQKASLPLETEVRLADAAAALKMNKASTAPRSQEASMAQDRAIHVLDDLLDMKSPPK